MAPSRGKSAGLFRPGSAGPLKLAWGNFNRGLLKPPQCRLATLLRLR